MDPIKLQKALKGVSYPADKDTLLDTARNNGADQQIVQELESIGDGEYESPARVSAAVKEATQ
jgi:hypothetical protein